VDFIHRWRALFEAVNSFLDGLQSGVDIAKKINSSLLSCSTTSLFVAIIYNLCYVIRVTEARDSEWQWNLLGHMQACTSLQTDNHAKHTPTLND